MQQHTTPQFRTSGVVVLASAANIALIAAHPRNKSSPRAPCTTTLDEIRKLEPSGIVLSGGPSSVYDPQAPK